MNHEEGSPTLHFRTYIHAVATEKARNNEALIIAGCNTKVSQKRHSLTIMAPTCHPPHPRSQKLIAYPSSPINIPHRPVEAGTHAHEEHISKAHISNLCLDLKEKIASSTNLWRFYIPISHHN